LTRFKHIDRYKDGFYPHLIESEFSKTFKPREFVFIGYMGDISFATPAEALRINTHIRKFPDTRFLLCTKNPYCFFKWDDLEWPDNVVIATTIETNRLNRLSKAPTTYDRFATLLRYHHPHKMVSIEPIMDFDPATLLCWIDDLQPEIVEVGADNYKNSLPEPDGEKLDELLARLRQIVPIVIEKDGLDRIR